MDKKEFRLLIKHCFLMGKNTVLGDHKLKLREIADTLKISKWPKTQQWASKVMASVFWDAHGILINDYHEKSKNINSGYYMALLDRLSAEIRKKRPHMQKKKVLFHQGNAPYHKSMKTMVKLNELSFKLLPHPPHSPDLAPSDYWLFTGLENCSRERDLAPIKK